ncbi:unnamed protein product [Clonostachys rosea]|uniref:Uncharacterized protein n=1 Tax=Bionectria ochroleuca TaxID=29856 RepID=A0ABY6UD54_BIOOC|nr:unnamed protein product [Clonostachys rosea]
MTVDLESTLMQVHKRRADIGEPKTDNLDETWTIRILLGNKKVDHLELRQSRTLRQYPEEDNEESDDASSQWRESTPTTHPRRPILRREYLSRHDSDPRARNPFSRETPQVSGVNGPTPQASNSRIPTSTDTQTIRVMDRDRNLIEVRSLIDNGNKLGHLVSNSTIDELGLWYKVNQNNTLTGTTLAGRLNTLGSINLDYYHVNDGSRCTATFHVFDDRFYRNHDILFSLGGENDNSVAMTKDQWNGKESEGGTRKGGKRQSDSGLCGSEGRNKREETKQGGGERENRIEDLEKIEMTMETTGPASARCNPRYGMLIDYVLIIRE